MARNSVWDLFLSVITPLSDVIALLLGEGEQFVARNSVWGLFLSVIRGVFRGGFC